MATTPVYGFRYQTLSDQPDGPHLGQNGFTDVENKIIAMDAATALLQTQSATKCAKFSSTNAQALTASTNTILLHTTTDYNKNTAAVYSTGVITLQATGLWELFAGVEMTVTSGGVYCWIGHGSLTTAANRYATVAQAAGAGVTSHSMSVQRFFNSGDTIAQWAWGQTGTVQTVVTELQTHIGMRYLGNPT